MGYKRGLYVFMYVLTISLEASVIDEIIWINSYEQPIVGSI